MNSMRMLSAFVAALLLVVCAGCTSGGGMYSSDHSNSTMDNAGASGSSGTSGGSGGY